MRLRDERAMRRRDDEQRIDPRAAFFDDVTVLHDHERRATANAAAGLGTESRERVGGMLLPVAVRLEDHGCAVGLRGEFGDHVLDEPRPDLARERSLVVG